MNYEKKPETAEQHYSILLERGLVIEDKERALKYLRNVGYFRLTGYMFHLQSKDGNHKFMDGAKFEDIINLYQFDKKIRGVIAEYLERIEICLRAKLTDKYSVQYGFFWYNNQDLYQDQIIFNSINREIADSFKDPKRTIS